MRVRHSQLPLAVQFTRMQVCDSGRQRACIVGCGSVLEDAAGYGDAETDQDQAAEQFAPLAGLGAEPAAQLQAGQGHGDADGADDAAATARFTWKVPSAKPTARLSMLSAAPVTSNAWPLASR